jgi:hypothetical protein
MLGKSTKIKLELSVSAGQEIESKKNTLLAVKMSESKISGKPRKAANQSAAAAALSVCRS